MVEFRALINETVDFLRAGGELAPLSNSCRILLLWLFGTDCSEKNPKDCCLLLEAGSVGITVVAPNNLLLKWEKVSNEDPGLLCGETFNAGLNPLVCSEVGPFVWP